MSGLDDSAIDIVQIVSMNAVVKEGWVSFIKSYKIGGEGG
jgi:hypothetical protein